MLRTAGSSRPLCNMAAVMLSQTLEGIESPNQRRYPYQVEKFLREVVVQPEDVPTETFKNAHAAARRIHDYLRLMPGTPNLGAEIAYSDEFHSDDWPHGWYPLTREDVEALLVERDKLCELVATCVCGTPGLTYEGPVADCPVHGAVEGLNKANAKIGDLQEALDKQTALAEQGARANRELKRLRADQAAFVQRVTDELSGCCSECNTCIDIVQRLAREDVPTTKETF